MSMWSILAVLVCLCIVNIYAQRDGFGDVYGYDRGFDRSFDYPSYDAPDYGGYGDYMPRRFAHPMMGGFMGGFPRRFGYNPYWG